MIETNDKMDFSGHDKNINAMMQEIVNSQVFGSFKAEVDGKNNDRIFRTAPHTLCFILHGDET